MIHTYVYIYIYIMIPKDPLVKCPQFSPSVGLASKVLIVDFDVHHGNGTQKMFEYDSSAS